MTGRRKAELSKVEMLEAQLKELQGIVTTLCERAGLDRKLLIADGVMLVNTKQAMHVTGLSRSGVQKLIDTKRVHVQWCGGRWFIDPATLPRRR